MTNINNAMRRILSCKNCTFSPFCLEEGVMREQTPVKQHQYIKRKTALTFIKNKFQHLYVVRRGAIKAYQTDTNGNEMIRGFYFIGEVFGYDAIYTGTHRFSAVALSDTVVCQVSYYSLLELLKTKPELQKYILYLVSKQLDVGSYLISSSAEQRLAAFLLDVSSRLNPPENKNEFVLPMSRQDMGNYLRLTQETVSRLLSRMKKNNLIEIEQKKICILQPEKLKELA